MAGSYKADAIVLRSLRYGEADRILHLYTRDHGRVGAIAKGVRRTRSRMGGRLEPLTVSAMVLHEGRGELHTVSQVETTASHQALRDSPPRLAAALIAAEATLALFADGEPAPKAFVGLTRLLDALETRPAPAPQGAARDPALLAYLAKALWVAGLAPRLDACAACGEEDVPLVAFSASAGGAVCASCGHDARPLPPGSVHALAALVARPIADAPELPPAVGDALAASLHDVIAGLSGRALRTLRAGAR